MNKIISKKLVQVRPEFMAIALKEASLAQEAGFAPVGAVIARGEALVTKTRHQARLGEGSEGHAEIAALHIAKQLLGRNQLQDCVLYSTYEPCADCTTASIETQIGGIVVGATAEDVPSITAGHDQATVYPSPNLFMGAVSQPEVAIPTLQGFMREKCRALFYLPTPGNPIGE